MKKNLQRCGAASGGRHHTHQGSVRHGRRTKATDGGSGELCGADDDDIITEGQSPLPQHTQLFSAPQGHSQPAGRGYSSSETHYPACTCLCVCVRVYMCVGSGSADRLHLLLA